VFTAYDVVVRELTVFAAIGVLVIAGFVLRLVLHTRHLPRCWNCGFQDVRPAQPHWLLDAIARLSWLYPYRCDRCQMRFYSFGAHRQGHAAR
jgi:hypothetical protein